jgi:hypothetical protein
MTVKLEEINKIEDWIKETSEINNCNFFLTVEWLNLTSKIFKLENKFLRVVINKKVFYISLQIKGKDAYSNFIGYGGLISKYSLKYKIINEVISIIKSSYGVSLKRIKYFPDFHDGKDIDLKIEHTIILPISDYLGDKYDKFHKNVGTSIRYALKNNVTIKTIRDKDLDDFYAMYCKTMIRVGSLYVTPKKLFEGMIKMKNVYFIGAWRKNKLIAGSIFMSYGKYMFYWWHASSEDGRKFCANYLIIYYIIKKAKYLGIEYLDMASSNNKNIEKWKLKWGGVKTPFYYYNAS